MKSAILFDNLSNYNNSGRDRQDEHKPGETTN